MLLSALKHGKWVTERKVFHNVEGQKAKPATHVCDLTVALGEFVPESSDMHELARLEIP